MQVCFLSQTKYNGIWKPFILNNSFASHTKSPKKYVGSRNKRFINSKTKLKIFPNDGNEPYPLAPTPQCLEKQKSENSKFSLKS